jgi:predicted nucleic acid-binding Zn ribbon protein
VADRKKRSPTKVDAVLTSYLEHAGLAARVDQAIVIPEWRSLVGEQIAAVTMPHAIAQDGTLFVAVTTNAWMTELSLMEPELLRVLNAKTGSAPILRIRYQLMRG